MFKFSQEADVGWDFEVDAWSRFWRWNLIKISVWACDTNKTSYFGKLTQPSGPLCLWQCFFMTNIIVLLFVYFPPPQYGVWICMFMRRLPSEWVRLWRKPVAEYSWDAPQTWTGGGVCVCLIFSELIFLVLYLHLSHKGVCVYVCAKYSLSEYNALL